MTKLAAFTRAAKAKYGKGKIGRADTTPTDDRRITSGSLRLDYALGGGYRVGWITSLYGEKAGGKTTTAIRALAHGQVLCRNCLRLAANVEAVEPSAAELKEDPDARWSAKGQCTCFAEELYKPEVPEFRDDKDKKIAGNTKKYKEAHEAWSKKLTKNSYEEFVCAWIDMETKFDKVWATKLGLDCRRVLFIRPEHAEEAIDIMHALACTIEVDFVVIDSIAQLVPMKELSESMEVWQQGLAARLTNKFVRKLVSGGAMVANANRTLTQIWINQTREKIGVIFGDPTVKPGGKGQEFAVAAEIRFRKSKIENRQEQYGTKEEVVDIPVKETFFFQCTKNQTESVSSVKGTYTQQMRDNDAGPRGRIIEEEEIHKLAMHWLVEQDKKTKNYTLAGTEYTSQKSMMVAIRSDDILRAAIKKVLLETMLKVA